MGSTPLRTSSARVGPSTPARSERPLEVGDAVTLAGTDLTGVLRYLGPVHGRDGLYAGLELTGLSYGQGKNDGTIQGVQYFATAPNNGVFGPASKLIALPGGRPASATARPLSALSGRQSREYEAPPTPSERPRRRQSGAPTPRATPRRSVGTTRARASPAWATPQVPRRAPTPGRPASSAAPGRPASAAHAHDDLLEQLALPPSLSSGNVDEAGVPTAEYERLCDELADVRRQLASYERERAERQQADEQREQEWDSLKRLELEDEARRRQSLERQVAELQRQLHEALDTATVAADVHDALERQSTQHAERIAELEAALAAAQIRAEHAASTDAEQNDPSTLTLLQTKVEQMTAAWARERTDLTDRIVTLQAQAEKPAPGALGASALEIDHANLKEQLAHLQTKAEGLEAELAEAKAAHEQATQSAHEARAAWDEERAQLRSAAAQCEARARDADALAERLRMERDECRATLERERAEAEALRDVPCTPPIHTGMTRSPSVSVDAEVVHALEARIAQLEREKAEEHAHFTKEVAELESLVESRIFREDELESELERLRAAAPS
ncbi:hypothetical protein MNAN1_001387 [Malassezia nana]|uniref:CAP-Gly domain-containing protein n=1 Tax=Malassezia nana TaxID=180528 RepID=A0AAF0J1W8_9BASI|nr:hypothetical protein MNAN1_001387 [Malassezia nana]